MNYIDASVITNPTSESLSDALKSINAYEDSLSNKIELYMNKEDAQDQKKLDQIFDSNSNLLELLKAKAAQIAHVISNSNEAVSSLYERIQALDDQQLALMQQVKSVDLAERVTKCIAQLDEQLRNGQISEACENVHLFRKLTTEQLSWENVSVQLENDILEGETQCVELVSKHAKTLKAIVLQRMERFLSEKNDQEWTVTWKLLPLLNEHQTGIQLLNDQIKHSFRNQVPVPVSHDAQSKSQNVVEYARVMSEYLALVLTRYQSVIALSYGAYGLVFMSREVEHEVDLQGLRLLNIYNENRFLGRIQKNVSVLSSGKFRNAGDLSVDMKELTAIIEELAALSHYSLAFRKFIVNFSVQALKISSSIDEHLQSLLNNVKFSSETGLLRNSLYSDKIKELLSLYYIPFEQYALVSAVNKAVSSDRYAMDDDTQEFISSCVDNSFFAVKKSLSRAVQTMDIDIICTLLNIAVQILDQNFVKSLAGKLTSGFGTGASTISENFDAQIGFVILLNDLEVSSAYCVRLHDDILQQIEQLLTFDQMRNVVHDKLREKVVSCASPIRELSDKCFAIMDQQCYTLYANVVRDRLKQIANTLISSCDFAPFKTQMSQLLLKDLHVMRNQVALKILEHCGDLFVSTYERQLASVKSFSQVGLLDDQVRAIQTFLFELINENYLSADQLSEGYKLRQKFQRLSQLINDALDMFDK